MKLAEHPTVRRFHESQAGRPEPAEPPRPLDAAWLRQLCLDCGADDAGLVEITHPALDNQRDDILRAFPPTRTLLSFVCRMNREPVRSPINDRDAAFETASWVESAPAAGATSRRRSSSADGQFAMTSDGEIRLETTPSDSSG